MAKRSVLKPQSRYPVRSPRATGPRGTRVVESFGAIGDLELHRLNQPADFTCATCRKRKQARLAATVKGSWNLTVCHSCYLTLIHERVKIQSPKQQPQQAKQKPTTTRAIPDQAKEAEHAAPGVSRQRTVVAKSAKGITGRSTVPPRHAGIRRMLQFFWAAGVLAWMEDSDLYVKGELTEQIRDFPQPDTDAWRRAVDQIVWRHAYDMLARAVASNARYSGSLEALPLPQERGFAIMRGRERIMVIRATHASVPGQPPVYGNFLAPGPHWGKVSPLLDGDADGTDIVETPGFFAQHGGAPPRAPEWRRVDRLPDDFDPVRAAACIAASQRIRLERQLDYPCPVILKSNEVTLTLEPISGEDEGRHVTFRVRADALSVDGKFLLRRYGPDPLPLLIRTDVADSDAIDAWVCALVGFADATCFELPASAWRRTTPRMRSPISVQQPRSAPRSRHRPRASLWPRHLKPEGRWSREGSWIVAAHRRHLPEGQSASAEALERARQAAIVLGPDETWVKAHFCGHAHVAEVHFRWTPTADVGL